LQSKIEKIEEEHRIELKVYKAKIRALDYEHQLAVNDLHEKTEKKLRDEANYHRETKNTYLGEIKTLTDKFQSCDMKNKDRINKENKIVESNDSGNFLTWDDNLKKSQKTWEKRLTQIKQDLELRLKIEIHEIEERQNAHINALLRQHHDDFNDIKE